jgi:ComF family protein
MTHSITQTMQSLYSAVGTAVGTAVDYLAEFIYPTRCVVCEKPGAVLCEADRERLRFINHTSACPRCGAPFGRRLCTECTTRNGPEQFAFAEAMSVLDYDEAVESIILGYKNGNERRLASELAAMLAGALPLEWRLWADGLTWISADRLARQRRGFDHMQLVAYQLAERLGLQAHELLIKQSAADQRRLSRSSRRENANKLFTVIAGKVDELPKNTNLLLIDDVFTTGATLDMAASALSKAGITSIRTLTIARVW